MKDKEFAGLMNPIVQKQSDKIITSSIENNLELINFECKVEIPDEISKELNSDIVITLSVSNLAQKLVYYYKGVEIKPESYFILPKDYRQVQIIEMLQEAIKQDTYNPDIKHLQNEVFQEITLSPSDGHKWSEEHKELITKHAKDHHKNRTWKRKLRNWYLSIKYKYLK